MNCGQPRGHARVTLGVALIALLLAGPSLAQPPEREGGRGEDKRAERREDRREHGDGRREERQDRRRDDRRDERHAQWREDHRSDHHHAAPRVRIGTRIEVLPYGHHSYFHHGRSYFYSSGFWYHPIGSHFVVTAPPIGLVIPLLPSGAASLYIGGMPYYRYADTYYMRVPSGYRVVEAPEAPDTDYSGPQEELFVYPARGQSAEQQSTDRFECHEWAQDQTGFDPTRVQGGVPEDAQEARRSDYRRAITACLAGRGYSVR